MSDQTDHAAHGKVHWLREGFRHAAKGYMFSVLLSFVLVMLGALGFPPVLALERAGIDFGMRVYVQIEAVPAANSGTGYVFLDIDRPACARFAGSEPERCDAGSPVPARLVADLVNAARRDRAKVIIADVSVPTKLEEQAILRSALVSPGASHVIAPLDTRPAADPHEVVDSPKLDIVASRSQGNLRLATVDSFTTPEASDAVIRNFPIASQVLRSGGQDADWLPSAPFLAALYASGEVNATAADCLFYKIGPGCPSPTKFVLNGHTYLFDASGAPQDDGLRNTVPRLFYSLPGITAADIVDQSSPMLSQIDRFRGYYDIYPVSRFIGGDALRLPPGLFSGRIVVIGSSLPAANDMHPTPLGQMAGSEILLNATRAFANYAPLAAEEANPSLGARMVQGGHKLTAKIVATTLAAALLFPAWVIASVIGQVVGKYALPVRAIGGAVSITIILMSLMFALHYELKYSVADLAGATLSGQPVDLAMPIIALALEAYAELADAILTFLHPVTIRMESILERCAHVLNHSRRQFLTFAGNRIAHSRERSASDEI